MSVRYVFNTKGEYVAFRQRDFLFDPNCEWIGFFENGNELYSTEGKFVGYLLDDDLIVKSKAERGRVPVAPPIAPLRPLKPLKPLKRMRRSALPHPWVDVFQSGMLPSDNIDEAVLRSVIRSSIVSSDGTRIGEVNNNPYDPNSIINEYGRFGSKYSSHSILNPYGSYGSKYSVLSAYNPYTTTPPTITNSSGKKYMLTKNKHLNPRIDPDDLLAWLKSHIGTVGTF